MSLPIRALIPALCLIFFSASVSAQAVEAEPNNTCPTAQVFGMPGLPFFVDGSLDPTTEGPDVDFYRFTGMPGEVIRVDLEGASTGMGTLVDPYLGLFSGSCDLLAISDDFGSLNSRLFVTVPEDGIYVLAATACCDSEFIGNGEGSYRMTLNSQTVIDSISGRLVDADSLLPLPGDAPPYASVQLFGCGQFGCDEFVAFQPAGPDGGFLFNADQNGSPLGTGDYQVTALANGYNTGLFGPFEVLEGEARDLAELPLTQIAVIGAVSGRLLDAINGLPLPGNSPPFAVAELQRCEEFGCFGVVGLLVDEQGRFRFEGPIYGLVPGSYRILAYADDYEPTESAPLDVGANQEVDFGDIGLAPLPIQFGEITGCDVLPIGGVCEFSVAISNRGPGRYRGEAWAIVEYFPNAWPYRVTRFQIGRMGLKAPVPHRINLSQDQGSQLTFQLQIPASAPVNSFVCVGANVGREPVPQFNGAGERPLFCATVLADGLHRLPDKQSRRQLVQRQQRPDTRN